MKIEILEVASKELEDAVLLKFCMRFRPNGL
jgi:hypothetical protein